MGFRIPGESASEARFRQRTERAMRAQEDQERRRHEMVSRQIVHRELMEETRQFADRMSFDMYLLAADILRKLEEQRDENMPARPEDDWNELFCEAVELIPEAKRFMNDCLIECIKKET